MRFIPRRLLQTVRPDTTSLLGTPVIVRHSEFRRGAEVVDGPLTAKGGGTYWCVKWPDDATTSVVHQNDIVREDRFMKRRLKSFERLRCEPIALSVKAGVRQGFGRNGVVYASDTPGFVVKLTMDAKEARVAVWLKSQPLDIFPTIKSVVVGVGARYIPYASSAFAFRGLGASKQGVVFAIEREDVAGLVVDSHLWFNRCLLQGNDDHDHYLSDADKANVVPARVLRERVHDVLSTGDFRSDNLGVRRGSAALVFRDFGSSTILPVETPVPHFNSNLHLEEGIHELA